MGNKGIQASRILFIKEILEQGSNLIGIAVKFIGRVIFYDPAKDLIIVEYQKARIVVSTALIGAIKLRCGNLLQLIGEISPSDEESKKFCQQEVMLVARIITCTDGMDLTLYERYVKYRREFEQEYLGLMYAQDAASLY
ncbi:hypothetical protein GpartN1_g2357.t1 [Galdieria partita]|uniref:Uncharacterized protein n=1 Tax=Galdieria partita TaxID=83374 RepID=A0A9C7PU53_9RHOD|nr:hypothetical protein GpartN1_g2357.t1 [Galdieria partita]